MMYGRMFPIALVLTGLVVGGTRLQAQDKTDKKGGTTKPDTTKPVDPKTAPKAPKPDASKVDPTATSRPAAPPAKKAETPPVATPKQEPAVKPESAKPTKPEATSKPTATATPEEALQSSYQAYRESEAIAQNMRKTCDKEMREVQNLSILIQSLKGAPPSAKQIEDIAQTLDSMKQQIVLMEARLELARIAKEEDREKKAKELEEQLKGVNAKQIEIQKPFYEKINALRAKVSERDKELEKTMSAYCIKPGSDFPDVIPAPTRANFSDAFIQYNWNDSKNTPVAWAQVKFREAPTIPANARRLDDKYYVMSASNGTIWLWVGNISVAFIVTKKEWQSDALVAKAIKEFLDLGGLAKLKVG